MPPKAKTPMPIDRPLSRAYLRDFSTWSTAFPPGVSDPTSLRIMENMQITREGALKVRPGLKVLSLMEDGTAFPNEIVGTHEAFYLNDGTIAYLFACKEQVTIDSVLTDVVGFRVLVEMDEWFVVRELTDAGIEFEFPRGYEQLCFSAETTYVKYLQIDNKIYALSDNGEPMRLFYVGGEKIAKNLSSILRPNWSTTDKLTVRHPDATWVTNGTITSTRTNFSNNPSFSTGLTNWGRYLGDTDYSHSGGAGFSGNGYMVLKSAPARINSVTNPVFPTDDTPFAWNANAANTAWAKSFSNILHVHTGTVKGKRSHVNSARFSVEAGQTHRFHWKTQAQAGTGFTTHGMLWRWWNAAGNQIGGDQVKEFGSLGDSLVTRTFDAKAPSGATTVSLHPWGGNGPYQNNADWYMDDVMVTKYSDGTSFFTGASGANYFWEGAVNASRSVYHPPADVAMYGNSVGVTPGAAWTGSAYFRAGSVVRNCYVGIQWLNSDGAGISTVYSAATPDVVGSWTRVSVVNEIAPAGAVKARIVVRVNGVPRGEQHHVDAVLLERTTTLNAFFTGDFTNTLQKRFRWTGTRHLSTSVEDTYSVDVSHPAAETKTLNTLISSNAASNIYSVGLFYCFFNEVGESAMSQVAVVKVQRPPTAWRWETPNAAGEPSGTDTTIPTEAADQLVASIPQAAFDEAVAQGATGWALYALSWSDQSVVPVTATRVATRDLTASQDYASQGWLAATPAFSDGTDTQALVPNADNRFNYSNPPTAGQGLVAADRMVVVNDPNNAARIRWTSNQQGYYGDFSASRGGGYKTLTSGNLQVPAAVKLWQNPQSVDTLTILCTGTDSYSTGYYMAPASITGQSETTAIMGFEETTATPGTTAPYGCEVMNNALYHPLDDQLMKSTATSYNINHKSMTDNIRNMWLSVEDHHRMVSSQLENRLYYLVNNTAGVEMTDGYYGNEVWVLDVSDPAGSWSRWTVGGISLRKMAIGGKPVMSLTRPDGIYAFSEQFMVDAYNTGAAGSYIISELPFKFEAETNTQGANRAHDAWAHLEQLIVNFGNWKGGVRYGIRGVDLHGQQLEFMKSFRANTDGTTQTPTSDDVYDQEDFLRVARDLKEWVFRVESIPTTTIEQIPVYESSFNYGFNTDFETNTAGWESNNALGTREVLTFARSTEQFYVGTASLKVTVPSVLTQTDGGVNFQGGLIDFPDDTNPEEERTQKLFSAWIFTETGGKFKLEELFHNGMFSVTVPANTWTRVTVPITNRSDAAVNGFYAVVKEDLVPDEVFYVDGVQIEEMTLDGQPTDYFNGGFTDSAEATYAWFGTPEASWSTRQLVVGTEPIVHIDSYEPAHGQINAVQYRYTPVSVNVQGQFGTIETFTYSRDLAQVSSNTSYGIPQPLDDARYPTAASIVAAAQGGA